MAYFAGAVGALIASFVLWLLAGAKVSEEAMALVPGLSWSWIERRLLWGSLFGMGYPLVRRRGFTPVRSGLVLSLLPSIAELVLLMPLHNQGFLGLSLGGMTPLLVLSTNALWGWALARIMISAGHS
jgi:hypothetical protein